LIQLYVVKTISFGGYAKESSNHCMCEGNEKVRNVSRVKLGKFSIMKPPSIILLCVVFPQSSMTSSGPEKSHVSFLKGLYSQIGHSEFSVLTHTIPRTIISEKHLSKVTRCFWNMQ
jgi:hypothetical protein